MKEARPFPVFSFNKSYLPEKSFLPSYMDFAFEVCDPRYAVIGSKLLFHAAALRTSPCLATFLPSSEGRSSPVLL